MILGVEPSVTFNDFIKSFKKIEPLNNFQIVEKCKELQIKNFKGVFMRNELDNSTNNECLILNIDHSSNRGTHWVALFIKNCACYYFDSYGFPPPLEVEQYCKQFDNRKYNTFPIQKPGEVICGHYCIYVLYKLHHNFEFYDILDQLCRN